MSDYHRYRAAESDAKQNVDLSVGGFKDRVRGRTVLFLKRAGIQRMPCICGNPKTENHHVDYEQAYIVAFLCRACHLAEHRKKLNKPFEVHDLRWLAVEHQVAFA